MTNEELIRETLSANITRDNSLPKISVEREQGGGVEKMMNKKETRNRKALVPPETSRGISEGSEGERSEPQRNGEIPLSTAPERRTYPDPEVTPRPQRRRFTAAYKARIVQAADACTEPGAIGALLRREGLYSSHLVAWRRLYRRGAQTALADDQRGRKPKQTAAEKENDRLRKQLAKTQAELRQAHLIIEAQKKIAEILGIIPPLPNVEDN